MNGIWHKAVEVPGTAAFNKFGFAQVSSVSCGSAGDCSAGGWYTDSSWLDQPFVVNEVNGTWHTAVEVPGMAALTRSIFGQVLSVSCGAVGNCSAGGWYTDSSDHAQAFVVSEVNGTWHNAIEVPGTAILNKGWGAWISSMSCASAGRCSAAGTYTDSSAHRQVFVVSQR